MGSQMGNRSLGRARNARVEAWLAEGGTVLAANERAARGLMAGFHAARLDEGLKAWKTPSILTWESWVRERWLERNQAGRMLLNPLQEQSIWTKVIAKSRVGENLLHRSRLAASAQEAYKLLCGYAPAELKPAARLGWSGDAAVFSEWLGAFEVYCRRERLVSGNRLVAELTEALLRDSTLPLFEAAERSPLMLVGFDRLLGTQEALLHAWGRWRVEASADAAQSAQFFSASDSAAELDACVNWLRASFRANPEARLMVVTTGLQARRGELERAMLELPGTGEAKLDFEFSLGVPLGRVSMARGALLILRWLQESLSEPELDWLLGSGHCVIHADEEIALAEAMRRVRRRGKERPAWSLEEFRNALPAAATGLDSLLTAWLKRLSAAQDQLRAMPRRQSALEWVDAASRLLNTAGWPGFRGLSSVAYQAQQRWEAVLEECGSLGFDEPATGGMDWAEFVATVTDAVSGTIFAAESSSARVQITEPLASAGQLAEGIWFLGADEENWPGRGQPHPLLPIGLQREAGMPHASPLADWKLAQEATARLLASADEVIFSYARQSEDAEMRPSRLVAQLVGHAKELPAEWMRMDSGADLTETYEDASQVPFPYTEVSGGAGTLTRQSLCAFQAFATARLDAEDWEPAEVGLNAKQRGQLLHAVLHRVWAGANEGGIASHAELRALADLRGLVEGRVREVMRESFDPKRRASLPARFPVRYLQLEAERLTRLVTEWLEYERERLPFIVAGTEVKNRVTVAGLTFDLRLDRVDELQNGSRLVIDYKSSEVGPKAWEGHRPDDVQLPLYASFAVKEELEGLVIARVRPGKIEFCGRVRDASAMLRSDLKSSNGMVTKPLTDRQLRDWREQIERLGEAFVAGRAEVDPKDPVKTCERCHLHAVCRIYENQPLAAVVAEEDSDGIDDGGDDGDRDA
jgi:ATP-dependent helicase/nuclease subunit B